MFHRWMSRKISKWSTRSATGDPDSIVEGEIRTVLATDAILLNQENLFSTEAEVQLHLDGYSDVSLNDYIIAKSGRWLERLSVDSLVVPPHVFGLLGMVQLAHARLGGPLRIIDFGGGAPAIPALMRHLDLSNELAGYMIVESPAFVRQVPADWRGYCEYADIYDGDDCDLLIFSGVLPYLRKSLVQSVYRDIERSRPGFIYFARTPFLPESYPQEEVFTIQRSSFWEHGAQIDVGMTDIENHVACYAKRHFKWSEIGRAIEPLGYSRVLSLVDDSGVDGTSTLGLYTVNSLWELND
jgi:putative methyltransferase (TIGR04325 family)